MLFFNANFICYYFYPTKKREEPNFLILPEKGVQYSLVFIKGSASGTRLACFPIAKQGNGVDLAPPGEGVRLRISVA